jgi:hypothetical protein
MKMRSQMMVRIFHRKDAMTQSFRRGLQRIIAGPLRLGASAVKKDMGTPSANQEVHLQDEAHILDMTFKTNN